MQNTDDVFETPRGFRLELKQSLFRLSPFYVARAKALWRDGMDTKQIAEEICVDEYAVYNSILKGRKP